MQLCGCVPLHSIWWSIKPITHFKKSRNSHADTQAQTQSGTHMVVGCLMEVRWCFQNHNDGYFPEREYVGWGGVGWDCRKSKRAYTESVWLFQCVSMWVCFSNLVGTKCLHKDRNSSWSRGKRLFTKLHYVSFWLLMLWLPLGVCIA